MIDFDFRGAKEAGYSDQEIKQYLDKFPKYEKNESTDSAWTKIKKNASNFGRNLLNPTGQREEQPKSKNESGFDYEGAKKAGYSDEEIEQFLSSQENAKQERSGLEKGLRVAGQYGLGALQASPAGIAYDLSTMPLSSQSAQQVPYREHLGDELESLMEKQAAGQWDQQDQDRYDQISAELQNPELSEPFIKTEDLSIRGLAEKATGQDLHPEGILEKAANWSGMLRNPRNIAGLTRVGLSPKMMTKAIFPSGKEALRGLTTGTALQMAEEGEFGPIGTMAMAVAGDLTGAGIGKAVSTVKNLVTAPKQFLAKKAAQLTKAEKVDIQKGIIKDFRDAGIQADLGSITDNNLAKWMQSRLAQSGLVGEELKEFKDQLTNQIKEEYGRLADSIGEAKFLNNHEAGQALQEGMKSIRDADLATTRSFYKSAEKSLKEKSYVFSNKLAQSIASIEKKLTPGALKSVEQKAVLDVIQKLKSDLYDSSRALLQADVKNLINNKIALNDIINYEVQGGTKQLLKGLVNDIDRAIISHGKENPRFAKDYIIANKRFSDHAKTFRNKSVDNMLRQEDPAKLMSKMDSVHGIRSVKKILDKSPQGKEIFDNLKRHKIDDVVGKNMVDSTTQQVKLGTFSKLLEKGKNRDLFKELLSPNDFKRLERLQRNAGHLAESANEFYNASKSGVVAADAAVIGKGLGGVASLLMGNPWPLGLTLSSVFAGRKFSALLADPEFLKLVEDFILRSQKSPISKWEVAAENLRPYFVQASKEFAEDQ